MTVASSSMAQITLLISLMGLWERVKSSKAKWRNKFQLDSRKNHMLNEWNHRHIEFYDDVSHSTNSISFQSWVLPVLLYIWTLGKHFCSARIEQGKPQKCKKWFKIFLLSYRHEIKLERLYQRAFWREPEIVVKRQCLMTSFAWQRLWW